AGRVRARRAAFLDHASTDPMSPFPLRRTRRRAEATGLGRQPAPPCACARGATSLARRPAGLGLAPCRTDRDSSAGSAGALDAGGGFGGAVGAPSEVLAGGFAEGAQRLFQALLLGSVGRPVPAPQRVLGTVPDLPRPLPELTRRRRVERRRGRRPRSARRARGVAAEDAGERLLERR